MAATTTTATTDTWHIRAGTRADCAAVHRLICELAVFEKEPLSTVEMTVGGNPKGCPLWVMPRRLNLSWFAIHPSGDLYPPEVKWSWKEGAYRTTWQVNVPAQCMEKQHVTVCKLVRVPRSQTKGGRFL